MSTLKWLQSLCRGFSLPLTAPSGLDQPLLVDAAAGGQDWWTVATDRRALVALRYRVKGVGEASPEATKTILKYLTARPVGVVVPWLDLKSWIGTVAPRVPCEDCGGTGVHPSGQGRCHLCEGQG